ncbi:hypothetical protein [Nocardia sp. NPDC050175]|uniref:hypothetical protein n=1 Tax=Nocardia sp. NPDC050175 TaxID=3364317 RepID=UPI00379DE3E3
MNRSDLSRRMAALAGVAAVVSGASGLVPAVANAAKGEVTITGKSFNGSETVKKTYTPEAGPKCYEIEQNVYKRPITIVNETDKPVEYALGDGTCAGEEALNSESEPEQQMGTLAPGAKTQISWDYGFAFVIPGNS